ncbi:MAG: glycerol-3-phosphate acyltransferase [Chloroflexota bacterium]|nr:glycerol-3-phosphate acyltransferase [Chloroflexota bacterium]
MNAVAFVLWVFGAFLIGALPLSVWVGSLALGVDVRAFGDGNPGATNVYRAGGRMTAFFALFLDFLKGALPVGTAAYVAGINFPLLAAISLAPVAGHAFSPFLRWRGGKAVAVTFGIWAGLTAWEGPIILGVGLLVGTKLFGANGWAVLAALLLLAVYLAAVPASLLAWSLRPASNWLLMTLAGNLLLLIWKHRQDLMHLPTF